MHGRLSLTRRFVSALAGALIAVVSALTSHALAQGAGLGAAGELVDPDVLRVCADPSNMPMTDKSGEGFENKLADLLAKKLGRKSVAYTWHPQIQGFVRNTLRANLCDVIMGYPQGDALVQNTNAYYRSAFVMVYKKDSGLSGVETIEDPKLAGKRIGIVEGTPPSRNVAAAKLMRLAKPYRLMVDTRVTDPIAQTMIKDLVDGTIDAAIIWGPLAGYFAKAQGTSLEVIPLLKEKTGSRMVYRITMGVRPSDQNWKRELNAVIKNNQAEINKILLEFGVPLVDEQDKLISQ
jgi:mxaJ protein